MSGLLQRSHAHFSRRLDWSRAANALALAEEDRRRSGQPIWDLTVSNPTAVGLAVEEDAEALDAALRAANRAPYAPDPRGERRARCAVADAYARAGFPSPPADWHVAAPASAPALELAPTAALEDRLVLTASSSESYSFLWKVLADPGDTVLVPEPSYPLFDYLARLEGVTAVPYRLTHDGTRAGRWHLDLASVERALAQAATRVAALVVVSPNNPTGSVLTAAALAALDDRAARGGYALVADEVFADYVANPLPDQVRFVAGSQTAALTFSLGGLSKSCGLPQLKLGWIAVGGPPALADQALARLELVADTYLSVATPVQIALPELLRLGIARRRAIAARVAENRRTLEAVADAASPLTVLRADGGWSAIVRLPAIQTDEEWALELLEKDGVLLQPGYFFDLHDVTCVVISLLTDPHAFRDASRRIAARVAQRTSG